MVKDHIRNQPCSLYSLQCIGYVQPLSVELGPGILENIFDGIQVHKLSISSSSRLF